MLIPVCFAATYLLQLDHLPETKGATKSQVLQSQEKMMDKLRSQGLKVTKTGSQTYLTNVLKIEVEEVDAQRVNKVAGVKQLVKSVIFPVPKVLKMNSTSTKPLVNTAHELTGVNEVRKQYKLDGSGTKIGIVDTGIDYKHSAFANENGEACLGAGCRVILGYDFSGENEPNDPMDIFGHGTHVSGIVGGFNKELNGVAPGVVFGAYKVFGSQSGASDFSILSALTQATKDQMDIINLSLGSPSGWDHGILEEALEQVHLKNIIVVAANGNDGREGLYMAGSPAIAKNTLAVASMDNKPVIKVREFIVNEKVYQYQYDLAAGTSSTPALPLKYAGNLCQVATGFPARTLALVDMGGCSMEDKVQFAEKSGITVLFLINDSEEFFLKKVKFAVLYLKQAAGAALKSEIGDSTAQVTFNNNESMVRLANGGGDPSFFTSWGLGSELQIKPEIGAPGHQIFSSIPRKECGGKDCYDVWSGTSMATPYVVGCAALYLQQFKNPADFKSKVMNTAVPAKSESIFSVAQQGSGMINMKALIESTVIATPSKLTLGANKSKSWTKSSTITLKNSGSTRKVFTVTHDDAIAVRSEPQALGDIENEEYPSTVAAPKTVSVEAGNEATFVVKITPNKEIADSEHWIFSGYLKLTAQEGEVISIPFGGFKGDYQSIDPMSDPENQFPFMLKSFKAQKSLTQPEETFTTTFNEKSDDIPLLIARFVHPVEALQIQLFNKKTNKALGLTHYQKHMGRHSASYNGQDPWSYMHPFVFTTELENGKYCVGCIALDKELKNWIEIPNGEYYLKLIVQKAMGDVKTKKHYVEWKSPTMIVARRRDKRSNPRKVKQVLAKSKNLKSVFKHLNINVNNIEGTKDNMIDL